MATISSHLKCPSCLQEYNIPKLLPCLHSVCLKCLEKCIENYLTMSEENCHQFQCPVCTKIVTKPLSVMSRDQWVGHFPVNAVLQSLLPKVKAKVDQICDPCLYEGTSIAAKSYCATCKEALCESCDSAHRKSRASREHTFLTTDETTDIPVVASFAFGITCTYHLNKDMEFFCSSHDSVCCADCLADYHRGCSEILNLKQHADTLFKAEESLMMTERIKQLDGHLDKYTVASNETLQKLEISTKDMTSEIDKLIATLNEAKLKISMDRDFLLVKESQKRRNESQQCQSLKAALQDSLILLSAVVKYGNKHQSLVMLHKIKEQLVYCEKTIHDKYSDVRDVKARLKPNKHFISLRKITGSQVAKIKVEKNKLRLPFQHNCDVSSGLSFTSTIRRDLVYLALDEDDNAVEKSSDFDGQKITQCNSCTDRLSMSLEPIRKINNKGGIWITSEDAAAVDEDVNAVEKSSDFDGQKITQRNSCTDGLIMYLEALRKVNNKGGIRITAEGAASDLSLPSNWTKMSPHENMKCVTLNPNDKEYKDVSQKFLVSAGGARQPIAVYAYVGSMHYGTSNFTVVQIERVQNKTLYQQYKAKKKLMETQNKGVVNEKTLWHGTAGTNIANISYNGFNRSYGGSGSHGAGTYFAVNASYSVGGYCNPDANGHRHIYLANVLTGDSVIAGSGTRVLPPKDPNYPHITYDSTTDNKTNPQMFVIFHDTQAYPSYHITFY